METTIGGDRLGSGGKQTTSFRNYERSSHDLGFVWRSSMASGTLVPFLCKLALPGDTWDIKLNTDVMTLPTIGPLFGSYKVQLDVFEVPIRLYNAKLHMNRLGIGMDMKNIFLPQIEVRAVNKIAAGITPTFNDNEHVNASSLLKYLGISGLGAYENSVPTPLKRNFNAVPYLAYWDIYKNYYANKQEEIGMCIHTSEAAFDAAQVPIRAILINDNNIPMGDCLEPMEKALDTDYKLLVYYGANATQPNPAAIKLTIASAASDCEAAFTTFKWDDTKKIMTCGIAKMTGDLMVMKVPSGTTEAPRSFFSLNSFTLENIDRMRDNILQHTGAGAFIINDSAIEPYSLPMRLINGAAFATVFSQEALAIKTYQSDLFNNWISTEWIDGTDGISALTAVDTTDGSFTMDALNIASKVYDMLNRIAVSGGTYDDWLEAVYTHERVKGVENPVYLGSLIKELSFEEIVSTSDTYNASGDRQPLGTLAGRGRLTGKHKGGTVRAKVNEPAYLIGIVSLTPRIDYSQGNEWDMNLKTLDDLHKPALDGIGFQDLVTDQLLWTDTIIASDGTLVKYSLGKQPAWINYMTAVNKTYGAFAEPENSMFMTLNRRYEKRMDMVGTANGRLKDGTTYIDPTKFNHIFAETALSSQNFWVQISCDITARRKMSAKIIPNL
ncbi:MAG: major capsid protein [Microviridae sp.]|nr:MAG: major capsid protein [Microviridae sp.]